MKNIELSRQCSVGQTHLSKELERGAIVLELSSSVMCSHRRVNETIMFRRINDRMWESVYEFDGRLIPSGKRIALNSKGVYSLYREVNGTRRRAVFGGCGGGHWVKWNRNGMRPNTRYSLLAGVPGGTRLEIGW